MSVTVKLLVLPSLVIERMSLHTNIDEKLIRPEIKAAQDMYIRPLLGSILFDKILNDISNDSLAGKYLELVDDFLVDAICNYVMAGMPEALTYQFFNKGMSIKTTDNSQQPSMTEMYAVIGRYKKRAEHYANTCRLHILQNVTDFPEYYAPGGVDKVVPDASSFTCPIYLGEREYNGYGRANHNPNYNSNDPYYPQ